MTDYSIDALNSHSENEIFYDELVAKSNSKCPFNARHFNRPRVVTSCKSPTATVDTFAKDLDINVIVRKYALTGHPLPSIDTAVFGVDATVNDYVEKYQAAKDHFMQLPSALRAQFNNDVQQFSSYLSASSDKDVASMLKKYGLIKEDVAPAVGESTIVITPQPVETSQPTSIKEDLSAS